MHLLWILVRGVILLAFGIAALIALLLAPSLISSWRSRRVVEAAFSSSPNVRILELFDDNEEFPFVTEAEVYVALEIDGETTIELWDLSENDFDPALTPEFMLYRVNGAMPSCGTSSSSTVGLRIGGEPHPSLETLGLRSPTDVVAQHRRISAYFSGWPLSAVDAIEVVLNDGPARCWLMTPEEFRSRRLDEVLP